MERSTYRAVQADASGRLALVGNPILTWFVPV
jgi:hypothetical protein